MRDGSSDADEWMTDRTDRDLGLKEREAETEAFFRSLQQSIVNRFERFEKGKHRFQHDPWVREQGGGGVTCVLQDGAVFEKFGIGFSVVEGAALPSAASARRQGIAGQPFRAMGVSLVAHPRSPHVPTSHMNVRYFRTRDGESGEPVWWFGGGYDLTPYYPHVEDCVHWHRTARSVCDRHYGRKFYEHLKQECDAYFQIPHRGCARGIGGVFFDDLNQPGFEAVFAFVQELGHSFGDAYAPIVQQRIGQPYGERERAFQLYRRGRYVEFNLVYDRGTLFGLQSGGRVESILMSLPPLVRFDYGWKDEPGSPEASLESDFLIPRNWADEDLQPA
jgi:coproporphyrinogen III oxidase